MIHRFLGNLFGKIKLFFYKLLYPKRINYNKKGLRYDASSVFYIDRDSKVTIGYNFLCRRNAMINSINNGNLIIGNNVGVGDNAIIGCQKKITIGDGCVIGNNCTILDNDHDYRTSLNSFVCDEIVIGDNVWLGCNSIVLKGVKIGKNSIIAAGTVVNKDIPENSLVYQKKEMVIKKIKK